QLALLRFEPKSYSVRDAAGPAVQILAGGSLERPGDAVTPGVLSAVRFTSEDPNPDAWNISQSVAGRRLELARWIVDRRNPLTSRVFVNRVWQMHFGTGLVATPNNFGKMGARPTHPELLDWLAGWFVDNGWSVKKLHRLIMTSEAYRRASSHPQMEAVAAADPKNAWLAYFPPRRLTAEEIRDASLAISGELRREMGGPGTFPEINWEVAMQPRHIMGSIAPTYQPSPVKQDRDRRSIYNFRRRSLANPMLEVLNQPSPDLSCERRDATTVSPQVFALFNGENMHRRALATAQRLTDWTNDEQERIDVAFRLTLGRLPTTAEKSAAAAHVVRMTARHRQTAPQAVPLPTSVAREMIDEQTGLPFRWQEKLHWMLDYERDLMPWDAPPQTRALAELCLVLMNANEFVYVY
ncbi:MAG: DUF1553 domain-containing protein, partial [Planctomycetales bacterium]|nr:DUF1553 domain-containing protein [Planctomycetales bacterium]